MLQLKIETKITTTHTQTTKSIGQEVEYFDSRKTNEKATELFKEWKKSS